VSSELFLSRFAGRTWTAVREEGRTTELRAETDESARSAVGRIVKSRVTRVLPGMQVAFVDVGLERDGFLHVSELVLPGEHPSSARAVARVEAPESEEASGATAPPVDPIDADEPREGAAKASHAPIQDRLREGRELLVQITREPIRDKGPRVSAYLSLAGRVLVYLPQSGLRGVSRRIRDADERARLRALVEAIHLPGGFILRTAAEGIDRNAVRDDAERLVRTWQRVQRRAERLSAPATVHEDGGLLERLLRDAPAGGYDRIVVDDTELRDRVTEFLIDSDRVRGASRASRVELHADPFPMFESHGLEQDIERALRPRVWLKSGGYIVIEPTEALVSIDVNTGKYVGRDHPEETVLRTNLEAAAEIARQLKLRDLGGIIVVDFIDMSLGESRDRVLGALEAALATDRARTKIVGISELGLVQMTRKRVRPGLGSLLTRPCPACKGTGQVKRADTVAWEALREVYRHLSSLRPGRVVVRAQPEVLSVFASRWHALVLPDGVDGVTVELVDDASLDPESFDVELH
jgi:ribonuclease G